MRGENVDRRREYRKREGLGGGEREREREREREERERERERERGNVASGYNNYITYSCVTFDLFCQLVMSICVHAVEFLCVWERVTYWRPLHATGRRREGRRCVHNVENGFTASFACFGVPYPTHHDITDYAILHTLMLSVDSKLLSCFFWFKSVGSLCLSHCVCVEPAWPLARLSENCLRWHFDSFTNNYRHKALNSIACAYMYMWMVSGWCPVTLAVPEW